MCERLVTFVQIDSVMKANEIPNCGRADCWFCGRQPDLSAGFHVAYFDAEQQLHIAFCADSSQREAFCSEIETRLRKQTPAGRHHRFVLRRAGRYVGKG